MIVKEKYDILESAWVSICRYVKNTCGDKFVDGIVVSCEKDEGFWVNLMITDKGEARIYRNRDNSTFPNIVITANGSYSIMNLITTITPDKDIENNYCSELSREVKYKAIEFIVHRWSDILYRIQTELKGYYRLINFTASDNYGYVSELLSLRDRLLGSIIELIDKDEVILSDYFIDVRYVNIKAQSSHIGSISKRGDDSFSVRLVDNAIITYPSDAITVDCMVCIYNSLLDLKNGVKA